MTLDLLQGKKGTVASLGLPCSAPAKVMSNLYRAFVLCLSWVWLVAAVLLASPVHAEPERENGVAKYKVRFDGEFDAALGTILRSVSKLVALQEASPQASPRLRRRANADMERFTKALRSEGYYSSLVRFRIDERAAALGVIVTIEPGPAYLLKSYDFDYEEDQNSAEDLPSSATEVGFILGGRARAPEIIQVERQFIDILAERGWPFAKRVDRTVVVDHGDHSVAVTLSIDPGPRAVFGETQFQGLRSVEEAYVRRFVPWKPGESFDSRRLEKLRADLSKTRLFRSVVVDHPKTPGEETSVPITVKLSEAKLRSYEFGAKWGSSEGFGGEASWEHRNMFGQGERLKTVGEAAEVRQGIDVALRKPNFRRLDQTLRLGVTAEREDNKAFEDLTAGIEASIERRLSPVWVVSAGTRAEVSQVTGADSRDTFTIFGVPLSSRWDTSDNLLDPTKGLRIDLDLTPNIAISGQTKFFLVSKATASAYKSVFNDRVVLAGRITLGSIVGTATDNIPASKRFHAGGGGSVRGYGFKLVGPLDPLGTPIGGRSLFEVGGEIRVKITNSIGLVPFFEGGNVYDDVYPDFSENLRWAAGIGLRYYTAVGPVRVDFAFPINRRAGIDDQFQFYISLGQAF